MSEEYLKWLDQITHQESSEKAKFIILTSEGKIIRTNVPPKKEFSIMSQYLLQSNIQTLSEEEFLVPIETVYDPDDNSVLISFRNFHFLHQNLVSIKIDIININTNKSLLSNNEVSFYLSAYDKLVTKPLITGENIIPFNANIPKLRHNDLFRAIRIYDLSKLSDESVNTIFLKFSIVSVKFHANFLIDGFSFYLKSIISQPMQSLFLREDQNMPNKANTVDSLIQESVLSLSTMQINETSYILKFNINQKNYNIATNITIFFDQPILNIDDVLYGKSIQAFLCESTDIPLKLFSISDNILGIQEISGMNHLALVSASAHIKFSIKLVVSRGFPIENLVKTVLIINECNYQPELQTIVKTVVHKSLINFHDIALMEKNPTHIHNVEYSNYMKKETLKKLLKFTFFPESVCKIITKYVY